MEEIKSIAMDFAMEFVKERKLIEKDPLLALAVASVYSDGFEYGYTFEGTKEDAKFGTAADKYINEKASTTQEQSPILYLLLLTAYAAGAYKGIEERDKIQLKQDQDGNIIGLTNV